MAQNSNFQREIHLLIDIPASMFFENPMYQRNSDSVSGKHEPDVQKTSTSKSSDLTEF